jgi:hypothetical protein
MIDDIEKYIELALKEEPKIDDLENIEVNYSQKRIKDEKKNGRKLSENISNKVSEQKVFTNLSDEELFCQENKDNLKEYLKKMGMCTDEKCLNSQCKNFIIIYTNKKVGSTSLWGSINLYLSSVFKTTHIHSSYELERTGIFDINMQQFLKILQMFNKNVFVIDIYRPVFDICVSNFFNELNTHFQRDFEKYPKIENKDIVIKRFFQVFKSYYASHNVDYYKEQYQIPSTNIPETFNFDSKHLIYKNENITYIKLRLCDSDNWHNILSDYFGYKFKIIKFNESDKKAWGPLYKHFKENYKITTEIFNLLKDNIYFNYYYTPEEQEKYLLQFKDKIDDENKVIHYTKEEFMFYNLLQKENEVSILYSELACNTNSPIANNGYNKKFIENDQEIILKHEFYEENAFNEIINYSEHKNKNIIDKIIECFNECNPNIRVKLFMSINGQTRLFIDNVTNEDLEKLVLPVLPDIHDEFIDDFNYYYNTDNKSNKIINFPGLSNYIKQIYNYLNNESLSQSIEQHRPFYKPFNSYDNVSKISILEYIDIQNKILKINTDENTKTKLFRIIINPGDKIILNNCICNEEYDEMLENMFS